MEASHRAVDSVLKFEKDLTEEFDTDKKYSFESRGAVMMKVYSEEFTKAFNEKLNGMVERRMQGAIHTVGSFWYTAWVKAGKPDLSDLVDKKLSAEAQKELDNVNKTHASGSKIKGRDHDD